MNRVKWGVIGCGGIADRRTIPGIMKADNAVLTAVMDKNGELAQNVGKKYNVTNICDSEEELLKQDIDAVYIATPVYCHKEQAIAAMRAGKHVLIEKPAALTAEEAKELFDLSLKEGVKLGAALMMRFHTHHQAIKKLIEEGKIGEIVSIRSQFSCWYPDIEGSWRQKKALGGGGALIDLGVHCIDLLQDVTGLKACGVMAVCDTQTFHYEVDDSASLIMKMDNGAHAHVDVNFNIPDDAVQSRLEIYGTKGSIIAEGTLGQEEVGQVKISLAEEAGYDAMQNRGKVNSYFLEPVAGNMYTKEIEAFSRAILENTEPPVSIQDDIFVQKIVAAAYESSDTGKFIVL